MGDFVLEKDFEIVQELGRGGFALVREVQRRGEAQGVPTAVKVTPLEKMYALGLTRQSLVDRVEALHVLNRIVKSKNLIKGIDYRISDTDYFAFMELCRGGDLFDKICSQPEERLSENVARQATYNLLLALEELHELGVIHRDIKPDNILYRTTEATADELVLADFGCCIWDARPGQLFTSQTGSPGYMAPEMAAKEPYSALVDVFSLGVTVYEMLTGRKPWISATPRDLLIEVQHRRVIYPKRYWGKVSAEAKSCVKCMLEVKPADRWSAHELLAHPWFDALGNAPRHSRTKRQSDILLETDESGDELLDDILPVFSSLSMKDGSRAAKVASKAEGLFDTNALLRGAPMSTQYSEKFRKLAV